MPNENIDKVEDLEVIDPVILSCDAVRVCFPEPLFDIIETCKICGRCV